ncbi:MAG: ATP-binding protein [Oscillospiraceae bacterium]|nr:ATP-binding protein [Oscillospiraceae bacterium]
MNDIREMTANQVKQLELLETGLVTADCYISRNYLIELAQNPVVPIQEEQFRDTSLRFYHIQKFVYDKDENVNDKLISVYDALHELEGTAIVLISSNETGISFYLGACSPNKAALCGDILERGLKGNFPGSTLKRMKTSAISELLDTSLRGKRNVSSVSIVPSARDDDKSKFVQGMEKLIDTMQGAQYTALFVAQPVNKTELEYRKRGLEEMASALSPYVKTTLAYGTNSSAAVTKGMTENFSSSVNRSIANTHGGNSSRNESTTYGSNTGFSFEGFSSGNSNSRTSGYSSGSSWSRAVTEGTTDTTGRAVNTGTTDTTGDSRTITLEHINKSAEYMMKTVDTQLERIRDCESFGLWECSAYFISDRIDVSVMAANTYKALVAGDRSCAENSFVNVWDATNAGTQDVITYLRHGLHPRFLISQGSEQGYHSQIVNASSFISGKELPLFMGIPQKSVSGLTVCAIAEFGRNIFTVDQSRGQGDLPFGHIFHMGQEEPTPVQLDVNSFTSHCFIAGSTGSGKSNTTYFLLHEFHKRGIPFLVVEPAKGEYKSEFANLPGVHIFSTNPRYGQMLRLNPFWFDAEQIHILEHLDRLIEIFNACWEMYAAMPAILKAAAERIYTQRGWDLLNSVYLGEGQPQFPTFADLLTTLPEVIKTSGYSADTQGDYTGALVTRVASLANGISGQIFCSGCAVEDRILFDENTIVDLSRVGSTETKALIMGLLVMKLSEYRVSQAGGSNRQLRHITVLEEAHNLLKRTGTSQGQESANLLGKSVEMISNSIAEMRTYGEGFIIVDQSPTAVDISAIKNTNTKIIMRLPEKSDCEAIGNAMALNEDQVKELSKLPTGVAAVFQNNWLETALVKIPRAPSDYQADINPVDRKALSRLRGTAASCVMRQYFDEGRLNAAAIRVEVNACPAPEHKKQEVCDSVMALVHAMGGRRDIGLLVQKLMELTCCQGLFAICDEQLRLVELNAPTGEDYRLLEQWQNRLTEALRSTVAVEDTMVPFFTRLMIYAKANRERDTRYLSAYELLYERPRGISLPETAAVVVEGTVR